MKRHLLLCTLLGSMAACQQKSDIQPRTASLADEVVGNYQTNFYLDLSCIATPTDKMPSAVVQAETDSTVTLIYARHYPTEEIRRIAHISLNRQVESIQLRVKDSSIGTFQTDRIFTNNGMEKQGKVLRINTPDVVSFTGYKQ